MASDVALDDRLEDVRIADLARPAQRALRFQAIDRGLHGGVGGTRLGKTLLDLANRRVAAGPQDFQNLQFKPGKLRERFGHLLFFGYKYYYVVDDVNLGDLRVSSPLRGPDAGMGDRQGVTPSKHRLGPSRRCSAGFGSRDRRRPPILG